MNYSCVSTKDKWYLQIVDSKCVRITPPNSSGHCYTLICLLLYAVRNAATNDELQYREYTKQRVVNKNQEDDDCISTPANVHSPAANVNLYVYYELTYG